MELKFDYETAKPQDITIAVKPKWQAGDIQLHRKSVEEGLKESLHRIQTSDRIYDLHCQIRDLTFVCKDATVQSIPKYKPYKVKRQTKTQHKWNPDIHSAIRECRKTWGDWKIAEKPEKSLESEHHLRMKTAKTNLRKLIRQSDAKERETKVRKIRDNESNSKSVHALVRLQRKSTNSQTTTLCVDGTSIDSAETLCAGWQKHFEDLSTPKQINIFDYQYQDRVSADIIHIEEICFLKNQKMKPASFEEVRNAMKKLKKDKSADTF